MVESYRPGNELKPDDLYLQIADGLAEGFTDFGSQGRMLNIKCHGLSSSVQRITHKMMEKTTWRAGNAAWRERQKLHDRKRQTASQRHYLSCFDSFPICQDRGLHGAK